MLAGLCAYALLLCLLVWAETAREGALIDSLPRALWYSVVTMTTVGYGDLYPLTPLGRLIGAVFLLVSTGLLALLIGLAVSLLTGRLLPRLRLWLARRRTWYMFASGDAASRALAERLDGGLTVFCGDVGLSPEALFALPFIGQGERHVFALGEDEVANERLAEALKRAPARVYCRSEGGEGFPENAVPFSERESAARLYWQSRPWAPAGEAVALLGDGRYAAALLEQGLLTAPPGCAVDLFGDWSKWRALHPALFDWPGLGPALRFHGEDWRACPDVLRSADRVVLCGDDRDANREDLRQLRRYCATKARPEALCEAGLAGDDCFGGAASLYTPELVMRQGLDARARQLHALYQNSVNYPVPDWAALSEFKRRSNRAAADHLLTKLRLLLPEADARALTPKLCAEAAKRFEAASPDQRERWRRLEHDRWALFHTLYNWRRAAARDDEARRHPLLVPYDELDEAERRKDDNAWALLGALPGEETL